MLGVYSASLFIESLGSLSCARCMGANHTLYDLCLQVSAPAGQLLVVHEVFEPGEVVVQPFVRKETSHGVLDGVLWPEGS